LKGESTGSGKFLKKIEGFLEKEKYEEVYETFSLETATLLKADAKGQ
jgi:hypothetical protein